MSSKYARFFLCTVLAVFISTSAGCSKKQEDKAPAQTGSSAKATQQIQAPTLAPPPEPEKTSPETPPAVTQSPTVPEVPPPVQPPPPIAAMPAAPELPPALPPPPPTPAAIAQPVPFVPTVVSSQTYIEIILDASGSQAAPMAGTAKIDIQKNAIADVLVASKQSDILKNAGIGIRVFGSQKPLDRHDCNDTVQAYPISVLDMDAVQKALTPIIANGESPIAATLEAASRDFPQGANIDQIIVLIADGSDTCGVDPCQTAKILHTSNPKVIVHVIGFDMAQEDIDKTQCIATNSEGRFFLARNENELRKSLDEAVYSTVPYNLRLNTAAGATPIPTTITILKGGTEQIVKKETSFGTKSLRLSPGTYDILVEYIGSETKNPSKLIKGVDVLETTKVEQNVNFDLGSITLSSIDTYGKLAAAKYQLLRSGTTDKVAEIESGAFAQSSFITPGTYDIMAELKDALPDKVTLTESGVEIKSGESVEKIFRFQKGTLSLKGLTTQNIAIPFIFQIYQAQKADQVVANGALGEDGGPITLTPGLYDIIFIGQDPLMNANPRTKVAGVTVTAAETTEIAAKFEMGILKLSAVDGQGNPAQAEFTVRTPNSKDELGRYQMPDAKTAVTIPIPPGSYDIIAASTIQVIEPKPTVFVPNVEVTATTPVEKVVRFNFGTVRLRGRNAKEQPVETQFIIYGGGTEDVVATAPPSSDWLVFQISPGHYDALAESTLAEGESKPTLWIKDIAVEEGKEVSHEAIFTAGKLKIICRGPNNKVELCDFKVYQYGADAPLITGKTENDWQVNDIQPGDYYLEAGYVDPSQSVLLKKWINIKVGENEILEYILRF